MNTITCEFCYDIGHISRYCPNKTVEFIDSILLDIVNEHPLSPTKVGNAVCNYLLSLMLYDYPLIREYALSKNIHETNLMDCFRNIIEYITMYAKFVMNIHIQNTHQKTNQLKQKHYISCSRNCNISK